MNWLLILVLVVFVGCAMNGRRRGFIKTVFTLFSTIVALLLTMWISPIVSKQVQNNDKVIGYVTEKVSKVVKFKDMGNKKSDQVNFIDKLVLPKTMRNTLIKNNNADSYGAMAVDSFEDYVSNAIARIIINAAVFLLIMLIVTIGLAVLSQALNIISKLPIINGLNKTAGLFAGLLHGVIIIWIGCIFLTMLSSTNLGQEMFKQINESPFLGTIYNNNLLLNFIVNLGATLF